MECIYCGEKLTGRSDKKFCDNQCRSAYHNAFPNQRKIFINRIDKILHRNQKILEFANPEGQTKINRDFLEQQGFNFNYYTNIYRSKKGGTYYFCYDMGWLEINDTKVLIVNWQPYMKYD